MENQLYDYEVEPAKRPSFLTWLCILTFIGSGWSLVNCIWSYSTAHRVSSALQTSMNPRIDTTYSGDTTNITVRRGKGEFLEKNLKKSISKVFKEDNIRKAAIGGFIASLLTLGGALLMWWLKRNGFYLYIVGVVFGIFIPFYLFGNDLVAVGVTAFSNFFGLLFIALYALNFRALK